MAGTWSGTVDQYISMSAGGAGAVSTGASTEVMLFQSDVFSHNRMVVSCFAAGTNVREIMNVDGALFGLADFSNGYGSMPQGSGWYVVGITKPAGSADFRCHLWHYSSSGTGTMSHGVSVNAGLHGDGAATTEIRIGSGEIISGGSLALAGFWDSELSDAQLDTLVSTNIISWAALNPKALISLENWNGTSGCLDLVGSSTQQSLTGTITSSGNPTGFSFSLTATDSGVVAIAATAGMTIAGTSNISATSAMSTTAAMSLTGGVDTVLPMATIARMSINPLVTRSGTVAMGATASVLDGVSNVRKYWNGSTWLLVPHNLWNGTAWIPLHRKVFVNSAWQ